MIQTLLADFFDAGTLALLIPISAILVGGLTVVLKLMTNHQRQMAELYQKNSAQPELLDEIRSLRSELTEMKDKVNQQTLMLDRANLVSGTVGVRDRTTDT